MSPAVKTIVRIVLFVFIVGAGAGVMAALVGNRPPPEEKAPGNQGVVVRTQKVHASRQRAAVVAQGTVIPAREVTIQPEVQGRVVYRSENLVPGGRFRQGDVLLRIDASEYSLRAKQSASQMEQAQQELMIEQSRQELAAHEWKLIGEDEGASDVGRAVALRKPHMKEAEARMELAEHERGLAILNVGRTVLRAPFNGFMRDGRVNVGQYVSPATTLGNLVGSDEFWVQVSVPVESLATIRIPGFNVDEGEGAEVSIWQELGDDRIERQGQVLRLYGDVEPAGRMARLLARILDPLGVDGQEGTLPLLLGSYVHVDIQGQAMIDVVEVPRSAVHAGRFVYLYGPDDRLIVREVTIAWRRPESLLISKGLAEGDEIITSRIGNAVDGLPLRRVEKGASGSQAPDEPKPEKTGGEAASKKKHADNTTSGREEVEAAQ